MKSGICHSSNAQRHGQNGVEVAQDESHGRGGDGGYQQRDDRGGGDVEHQDFQHEDDARYRGLEDGRDGRSGAAAEQQGGVFVVEAEQLAHVRADGGPRQHDGGLGAYRAAEADGRGAAHQRGPAVVAGDARILARHGLQYARHPFGNVVADDIFDEQRGQDDADRRINQEQQMGAFDREPARQPALDGVEQHLEEVGRHAGQHTHQHRQQHHDLPRREPACQVQEVGVDSFGAQTHACRN